ncbi:BTB domain-containing protein [Mycena kentingensis (nom. inval.)]|nr:BTB domain-containing protein [Mycena kentingensis (nom. inval.)]
MSTEERPSKRPRDEDSELETLVKRSADYWFQDGSIVLQVESTQFRVAKTVLAMHSTIFSDMLSFPPANDPLVEGCPLVLISGDKSTDWKHLLDAMYPTHCFNDDRPEFMALAAVLRLSNKYDIPLFRQRCIARLKSEFPSSLSSFDTAFKLDGWQNIAMPADWTMSKISVAVINLAREVGLYSVLPVAFYTIVNRYGANVEMDGILSDVLDGLHSRADEIICLRGHARMTRDYLQTPIKCFAPEGRIPSTTCAQPAMCRSTAQRHLLSCLKEVSLVAAVVDEWYIGWEASDFCPDCAAEAKQVFEQTRAECWDKLPSYFALPPWDDLLKMDLE